MIEQCLFNFFNLFLIVTFIQKIMLRKFITPTKKEINIAFEFPEEYLGQELEIIIFKKQEGLEEIEEKSPIKLSEKYKGIFSKEDAENFNNHIEQIQSEWVNN